MSSVSHLFGSPAVRKAFRTAFHVFLAVCFLLSSACALSPPRASSFPEAFSLLRQWVREGRREVLFLVPRAALLEERPLLEDRGVPGFDLQDSLWNLIYALPEVFTLSYGTADNGADVCVLLAFTYRDGVRLLDAYRSGDLSSLTEEERSCLREALSIAREAGKGKTDRERIFALCALLCNRLSFALPGTGGGHEKSCLGALSEGFANCQGYSDAFYLTASLLDLKAGYQNGTVLETGAIHTFNTLEIDGETLYLDLTWMDREDGPDPAQCCIRPEELLKTRLPYPM